MVSVDPEGLGGPSPSSVQPCHFLTLAPIKIPLRTTPFSGKHRAWALKVKAWSWFRAHRVGDKAGASLPLALCLDSHAEGLPGEDMPGGGSPRFCPSSRSSTPLRKVLLSQTGYFLP